MDRIRVSVIVPTMDRPELLRRCLVALCNQDYDRSAYEVIIADDADSEETKRTVLELAQNGVAIRYVPVIGPLGPAAARNAGLRVARGEVIAFTDDDCIPRSDWLLEGMKAFNNGIVGASGRVVVPLNGENTDYQVNAARLALSDFVTANCFYRKKALLRIGGFDERFKAAWREDSDLFFTLIKAKGKFTHVPLAMVEHPVRPAPWGVSVLQQRKNMFNALLFKKHPELYRQKLTPVFPWHYYLIVLVLLLSAISLCLGAWNWALLFLGLWSAFTAAFCCYRLKETSHSFYHVIEMVLTSIAIPPTAIFWRLVGAIRYRVPFF